MLIHPWITVEPLGPVWPLCQETGIVLPADLVIHGSGRWSLTLHRSTLVWQPPIDEPRTVKHGVLSWERLRSTPDKPRDDDDDEYYSSSSSSCGLNSVGMHKPTYTDAGARVLYLTQIIIKLTVPVRISWKQYLST